MRSLVLKSLCISFLVVSLCVLATTLFFWYSSHDGIYRELSWGVRAGDHGSSQSTGYGIGFGPFNASLQYGHGLWFEDVNRDSEPFHERSWKWIAVPLNQWRLPWPGEMDGTGASLNWDKREDDISPDYPSFHSEEKGTIVISLPYWLVAFASAIPACVPLFRSFRPIGARLKERIVLGKFPGDSGNLINPLARVLIRTRVIAEFFALFTFALAIYLATRAHAFDDMFHVSRSAGSPQNRYEHQLHMESDARGIELWYGLVDCRNATTVDAYRVQMIQLGDNDHSFHYLGFPDRLEKFHAAYINSRLPDFRQIELAIRIPHRLAVEVSGGILAVFVIARVLSILRVRRRIRDGCCYACGYDLRASAGACPECGAQAIGLSPRGASEPEKTGADGADRDSP